MLDGIQFANATRPFRWSRALGVSRIGDWRCYLVLMRVSETLFSSALERVRRSESMAGSGAARTRQRALLGTHRTLQSVEPRTSEFARSDPRSATSNENRSARGAAVAGARGRGGDAGRSTARKTGL